MIKIWKNRIIKSLTHIGFSLEESEKKLLLLSRFMDNKNYCEVYEKCAKIFEENQSFQNDCLNATKLMLSNKIQNATDKAPHIAVKYFLAELPLWFNTPYILNI